MADKPRSVKSNDDAASRRALADLANLEHNVEGLPGTGMSRALRGAQAKLKSSGLAGQDDEQNDPAVIWGKNIGRGAGFALLAYLIYHLVTTYFGS